MVGVPIAIIAPPFFLISSVWLFVGVAKATFELTPRNNPTLLQQLTRCSYSNGKIHLTGALRVEGVNAIAIRAEQFAVYSEVLTFRYRVPKTAR
jgi:hypothetical protein